MRENGTGDFRDLHTVKPDRGAIQAAQHETAEEFENFAMGFKIETHAVAARREQRGKPACVDQQSAPLLGHGRGQSLIVGPDGMAAHEPGQHEWAKRLQAQVFSWHGFPTEAPTV